MKQDRLGAITFDTDFKAHMESKYNQILSGTFTPETLLQKRHNAINRVNASHVKASLADKANNVLRLSSP